MLPSRTNEGRNVPLNIQVLGADDTVTGSRSLLTYQGRSWLIDCGLFQGDKTKRERNWLPFSIQPSSLAGVLLTHAHLDHTGYLPRLCQQGYTGPIHATQGTVDLTQILLLDAAHLEEEAAAFANRTHYSNHSPAEPLFTAADAALANSRLVPHRRDQWIPLAEGLSFRFVRAGHIIGASMIQIAADLGDRGMRTVTFTGDLGNDRSHHLRPPEYIHGTDVLVLESTYGDRLQPREDGLVALAEVVRRTMARGGVLVIPAFAVGRAQELTYMLRLLEDQGKIPSVPVILDSPMATAAMEVCLRHPEDQVLQSAFTGSDDPFRPLRFEVSQTVDESMLSCMRDGPMIVISASGMLNGGRILHHLKARLPDPRSTVVFCGYQADGTKGRFLQDHSVDLATLRIHHVEVPIAAEIVTLDHLSSHADYVDTLTWLSHMPQLPSQIVLNHGEPQAQRALAAHILERFGVQAILACEAKHIAIQ
ncbi:MAG: MBL fold metallo-hydrolase [Proteobacteria bacterium]|nr:MBL fold metallo-hydrolase [Pseudomonadota bacterium]